MNKSYYNYIDTAKAVGVFLVYMSHSQLGALPLNQYFFSFHMPLFFLCAGFVTKRRHEPFGRFLLRRVLGILLPYVLFAVLSVLFMEYQPTTAADFALRLLTGTRESLIDYTASALWFLPCFFTASVLFRLIIELSERLKSDGARSAVFFSLSALCGALGAVLCYGNTVSTLPFGLNIALVGVLFMAFGSLLRELLSLFSDKALKYGALPVGAVLIALGVLSCFLNTAALKGPDMLYVVMAQAFYGSFPLFVLSALLSGCGLILVCRTLSCRASEYIGRNTLYLLGLNDFAVLSAHRLLGLVGIDAGNTPRVLFALLNAAVAFLIALPLIALVKLAWKAITDLWSARKNTAA